MNKFAVTAALATLGTLALAGEAGAVGRFSNTPKPSFANSSYITATPVTNWGVTDCGSFYGKTRNLTYSCTCNNYIGQVYDGGYGYYSGCYAYKRFAGSMANVSVYDIIFYFQIFELASNKAQRLAFGEDASNHVAYCISATGTTCNGIRHNTASPTSVGTSAFYGINALSGVTGQGATLLGSMGPGVIGYEVGREDKGNTVAFTPIDVNLINKINNDVVMYPPYGTMYQVGGYTGYVANSMCSQFAADAAGATCDEGRNRTWIPATREAQIVTDLRATVKAGCKDQGRFWAGYYLVPIIQFIAPIALEDTCNKVANQVINAFQQDGAADNNYPNMAGKRIANLTSPDDFYSALAALSQTTLVSCVNGVPNPPLY